MTIKNGLAPIHPGEFLMEALEELATSQAVFARAIGVSPMRISHVVNGARVGPKARVSGVLSSEIGAHARCGA